MANILVVSDATQKNLDISREFTAAAAKRPVLRYLRTGAPVAGPKFHWPEEAREAIKSTLAVNYTAGSTITVADGSVFRAGDLIHISGHIDTDFVRIVFNIVSIATNVLTVAIANGSDTSLTAASQVVRLTRPRADNIASGTGGAAEPTLASSFLQLHQVDLELGEKAIRAATGGLFQGIDDLVIRGLEQKLDELTWDIYQSLMYGVGRDESASVAAATKGFLQFINTASMNNRVDASADVLTETLINDLVEKLIYRGLPEGERKALVMNPANARALAALRHDKVTYAEDAGKFGGGVQAYLTEFSNIGELEIVVDPNMESDIVLLISPQWAELVPAQNSGMAVLVDSTQPGQYGRKYTIRSEVGLKVMYADRYHGAIVNIDPAA